MWKEVLWINVWYVSLESLHFRPQYASLHFRPQCASLHFPPVIWSFCCRDAASENLVMTFNSSERFGLPDLGSRLETGNFQAMSSPLCIQPLSVLSYHFMLACSNQFCKYFPLSQNQGGSARQVMKHRGKMRNA